MGEKGKEKKNFLSSFNTQKKIERKSHVQQAEKIDFVSRHVMYDVILRQLRHIYSLVF